MASTRMGMARLAVCAMAASTTMAGCTGPRTTQDAVAQSRQPMGLVTSLPIYWDETVDFDAALEPSTPHWARLLLQRRYELVPLDTLAAPDQGVPAKELAKLSMAIIAQPRALRPAEFAALDAWLRGGGTALIIADPYLTEHSEYSLGDPRRPQGAALLSPLFDHWGLEQTYDQDQPRGLRTVRSDDLAIPVDRAGQFVVTHDGTAKCIAAAAGVLADCKVGKGRAIILADAALLDREERSSAGEKAFDRLVTMAFGT